ncbi:MAG: DUF4271 domain-containing protein [Croceitalea sp.]|nr:DUF4271 domain-containing protein [Croceitalea sp.]
MNPIIRNITSLDWITITLFLTLAILAVCKYFFKTSFSSFMMLPFNKRYFGISNKRGKMFNWFHLLMTFFQVINMALFLYLARNILKGEIFNAYPAIYGVSLLILMTFLIFKFILQMGNGYFFENYPTMTDVVFEKLSYFNYSSLMAFFGNLFLVYILQGSKAVVYLTILLILLINIIGWVNTIRTHQKLIVTNFLYFILYLCTLEIAPLVIIGTYLKD